MDYATLVVGVQTLQPRTFLRIIMVTAINLCTVKETQHHRALLQHRLRQFLLRRQSQFQHRRQQRVCADGLRTATGPGCHNPLSLLALPVKLAATWIPTATTTSFCQLCLLYLTMFCAPRQLHCRLRQLLLRRPCQEYNGFKFKWLANNLSLNQSSIHISLLLLGSS